MSWLQDAALKLGDDMNALLSRHEAERHDGEGCLPQTLNLIAYLMHRAGVPADEPAIFAEILVRLRDYQAVHAEHVVEE